MDQLQFFSIDYIGHRLAPGLKNREADKSDGEVEGKLRKESKGEVHRERQMEIGGTKNHLASVR